MSCNTSVTEYEREYEYFLSRHFCLDSHTYAIVGDLKTGWGKPGYHVKLIASTSSNLPPNILYAHTHSSLTYGFKLLWLHFHYHQHYKSKTCYFNHITHNTSCFSPCYFYHHSHNIHTPIHCEKTTTTHSPSKKNNNKILNFARNNTLGCSFRLSTAKKTYVNVCKY
ncbi:hypothetical protein HN51_058257 [Arachis hypogaea]